MPVSTKKAEEMAEKVRHELTVLTGRDYSQAEVTCEHCGLNADCEFAWDHYNTRGECLASK